MRLKRLGLALVVVLALGAAMASSALATATTEDVQWKVEGTTLSGSETVTSTGSTETVTTIGTTSVIIKSSGLNCIGCQITNSGGSAVGTGELEFTGATVTNPPSCAISGGVIKTVPLSIRADYMEGTTTYWELQPAGGSTMATVTIVKGSGSCPIAGSYLKSAVFFGRSSSATGVLAATQTITFSGAINKAAGGSGSFAGKPVEFNATLNVSMAGANKGKKFGTG